MNRNHEFWYQDLSSSHLTINIPTFYFTVDLILWNFPFGHYVYGVKIDRFVDDIITILYGKILLCHDIKPQYQFTLISFHQTLHRAQTYFVDTVKREIQPYSFVELICRIFRLEIAESLIVRHFVLTPVNNVHTRNCTYPMNFEFL